MDDPAPIYGFDVVTGMKRPAGCYVDLSPSVHDWKNWRSLVTLPSDTPENKKLPEWSTIFSDDFIAIPPRDEEHMEEMFDYNAHKHYSTLQRNNAKTRQILSRMIGEAEADKFMSTVLFPDPPEIA